MARKFWPANIGPQILARKHWPANFGPQILACKFWPTDIGPQILARNNWPAKMLPAARKIAPPENDHMMQNQVKNVIDEVAKEMMSLNHSTHSLYTSRFFQRAT